MSDIIEFVIDLAGDFLEMFLTRKKDGEIEPAEVVPAEYDDIYRSGFSAEETKARK